MSYEKRAGRDRARDAAPEKRSLSDLRGKVLAVAVADCHYSHQKPRARVGDWYEVMENYLEQLWKVAEMFAPSPVLYAGDIFHTWKEPAELINFLIPRMPGGLGIPGQHDLPHHNIAYISRSPYQTLCRAGVIRNIRGGESIGVEEGNITGYPYFCDGENVQPNPKPHDLCLEVLLTHAYIWRGSNCFPGAPERNHFSNWYERLRGYDVAVFGDNHKGFTVPVQKLEQSAIVNCGCFIRRRTDEKDYQPCVSLICRDEVIRWPLDTSIDKWVDVEEIVETVKNRVDLRRLINELMDAPEEEMDFDEVVRRFAETNSLPELVRKFLLGSIEREKR